MHNKELGTVGVWSGVGHGNGAPAVLFGDGFVGKFVAGATHAGTKRITTLDHEPFDDAVKNDAVVERFIGNFFASEGVNSGAFSELHKVSDGVGSNLGEESHFHGAFVGFDNSGNVFSERGLGWGRVVHIGWVDFNIGNLIIGSTGCFSKIAG